MATLGVAAVSYVSCGGGTVANLMAPPQDGGADTAADTSADSASDSVSRWTWSPTSSRRGRGRLWQQSCSNSSSTATTWSGAIAACAPRSRRCRGARFDTTRAPRGRADAARKRGPAPRSRSTAPAIACAATLRALLECRAPLDLIAMAARFPLDELVHVELCARMAMELGGGTEIQYDPIT